MTTLSWGATEFFGVTFFCKKGDKIKENDPCQYILAILQTAYVLSTDF